MIKIPRIEMLRADQLVEPEKNPNHMSPEAFALLEQAIGDPRVGFLQPLLVREPMPGEMMPADETVARLGRLPFYRIVDGVHRFQAGKNNGMDEFPCVVLGADVDDATIAALQIAMNRLRGELNLADVARTLAELVEQHAWTIPDMNVAGFTESEASDLLKAVRPTVDDALREAALDEPETPAPEPDPEVGAFPLEIVFKSAKDQKRFRAALKKAAGKGNGLDVGALRMLDGESG